MSTSSRSYTCLYCHRSNQIDSIECYDHETSNREKPYINNPNNDPFQCFQKPCFPSINNEFTSNTNTNENASKCLEKKFQQKRQSYSCGLCERSDDELNSIHEPWVILAECNHSFCASCMNAIITLNKNRGNIFPLWSCNLCHQREREERNEKKIYYISLI